MIDRLRIFFAIAFITAALASCKKEAAQVQPPRPVEKAHPAQAQQAAQPAAPPDGEAAKGDSAIDAKRRNPFQSHIILMRGVEGAKKVKGPLECCELALFKVVAIVAGTDNPVALIQSPDNKRYIVRKGDLIGSREGRVTGIDDNGVSVREIVRDDKGNVKSSVDTVMMLRGEKEADARR